MSDCILTTKAFKGKGRLLIFGISSCCLEVLPTVPSLCKFRYLFLRNVDEPMGPFFFCWSMFIINIANDLRYCVFEMDV